MLSKNYQAWNVKKEDYRPDWSDQEKLVFFLRYAILAPSGNNSQPWYFKLMNNEVEIYLNKSRQLNENNSDLLKVEPAISLGTMIETFVQAGRGFGYQLKIEYFGIKDLVAKVGIGEKCNADTKIIDAITHRLSNRSKFKKETIPKEILSSIAQSSLAEVGGFLISDREDIGFVADQTKVGIRNIIGNPIYRSELSKWVRNSFTRRYEGMPGFTHGIPAVPSLFAKFAVKHSKDASKQALKNAELIENSGGLIILLAKNNEQVTFINTGRLYTKICLKAQELGYATSAVGASVMDPISKKTMIEQFKLSDEPIAVIRIGKAATKARHSPRWPLEKLISE